MTSRHPESSKRKLLQVELNRARRQGLPPTSDGRKAGKVRRVIKAPRWRPRTGTLPAVPGPRKGKCRPQTHECWVSKRKHRNDYPGIVRVSRARSCLDRLLNSICAIGDDTGRRSGCRMGRVWPLSQEGVGFHPPGRDGREEKGSASAVPAGDATCARNARNVITSILGVGLRMTSTIRRMLANSATGIAASRAGARNASTAAQSSWCACARDEQDGGHVVIVGAHLQNLLESRVRPSDESPARHGLNRSRIERTASSDRARAACAISTASRLRPTVSRKNAATLRSRRSWAARQLSLDGLLPRQIGAERVDHPVGGVRREVAALVQPRRTSPAPPSPRASTGGLSA